MTSNILQKVFFTIFILIIYRIGTYIPLIGVNFELLRDSSNGEMSKGIMGMFNLFTGGALSRMSIFSLNIMPYITASIVIQLMTSILNEGTKNENTAAQKSKYTRYLAVVIALIQGYGLAVAAENMKIMGSNIIINGGIFFRLISAISILGGTMMVVWLSDQITDQGIGNGSSIIIFSGIVAGFFPSFFSIFDMAKSGAISLFILSFFVVAIFLMLFIIVFFETAYRKIKVTYPKRQVGNKMYSGDSTHMPLKLNTSGVLGPIFASSVILFPTTVMSFFVDENSPQLIYWLFVNLNPGHYLYTLLYVILIMFFGFFYTFVILNPSETANNLKKNGAIVLGIRPGEQTASYIENILTKLTIIGSLYISIICVIPEIFISYYAFPFYLGGTSLLIVVNVSMEIFQQIQTHIISIQYKSILKKNKGFLMKMR